MKTLDEWNGITSLPYGIIMGHTWHEAGKGTVNENYSLPGE
jgi:hypothetical protein